MAINVADYQAVLKFDATEFKKGMKDSESSFSNFSGKLGTLAKGIGTGITAALAAGVTAMVGLTKKALEASGELEQNMGGSEAVFKEYATSMQTTAKEAFASMGVSTSDYLATANKMGALFQGSGFTIQESAELSANAMQRAADVASIMGIDTSAAMEAVAGAAKGNFTMMDNLGVAMNATTIEAYALSKGINTSYNEMTNQQKIGLAMDMFMEKSAYAAGNYAKENETLAGSLSTAKAAMTNFLDGSGSVDGLVTAFTNAGNVIVENLVQILPRLVSGITEIINQLVPQIPPLLQALLPAAVSGAVSLVNGLVAALPGTISALMSALPTLITGVQSLISGLLAVLPDILITVVDTVILIIPILVQSLIDCLPQLLDCVLQLAMGLCQGILDAIPMIVSMLPNIINSVIEFLIGAIPQIISTGIQLFTSLISALPEITTSVCNAIPIIVNNLVSSIISLIPLLIQAGCDLLVSLIQNLPTIIQTILTSIPQIISSLCNAISSNIPLIIQAGCDLLVSLVKNLPSIIIEVVKAIPLILKSLISALAEGLPQMASAGLNLIKGLFNGISDAVSWLYGKLKSWVSGVLDYIKGLFGIHSPSKETAVFGKYIAEGLGVGIEKNADAANEASEKLSDNVLGTFEDMAEGVTDIENGMLKDVDVSATKKVTLTPAYDKTAISGTVANTVSLSGNALTDGLATVFNTFLAKTETLMDKLISSVSVGSTHGVNTSRGTVINMGNISVSGVLDKGAGEQVKAIADNQIDAVAARIIPLIPN